MTEDRFVTKDLKHYLRKYTKDHNISDEEKVSNYYNFMTVVPKMFTVNEKKYIAFS